MNDETTQPPDHKTPAPPPPPPAQRPLWRRDEHKYAAGVAGGLADYLGINAAVVRIAFIVLAFMGVGVPLYLMGWVAMPSPALPQTYIERWFGTSPNPAALVAIAAAVIVLFAMSDGPGADGFGWGLVLLFGGWLLFRADSRATTGGTATGFVGPPTPPAWQAPPTWHGAGGQASSAPPPVWTPPPPRPPSILGRLTIGIALAAVGIAALLEQAGAIAWEPSQYLALGLTVVGLGLVAGAWVGRAYGLIPVGLILLVAMVISSFDRLPLQHGAGDVSHTPTDIADVGTTYGLGFGEFDLDLTRVDWTDQARTVTVTVGVGEATILVPSDVTVHADVEMQAGEIVLFGERHVGEPFRDPVVATEEGTNGGGRLDLIVDSVFGKVTVDHREER